MIEESDKITVYDSLDADVIQSYNEFQFTSLIYYTMKEAACSEQSSRMTAMDAASKNAGKFVLPFLSVSYPYFFVKNILLLYVKPMYSGNHQMHTLANSVDPDEMLLKALLHQGLHSLR